MSLIRITESLQLPLFNGTLEIDTSKGSITILMIPGPVHTSNEYLILTKISTDRHIVSLFSDTCLINNANIIIFGVTPCSKLTKGKIKTLILKSDGSNWKIIKEE